tara:strand:+ start:2252 stop:2869 length:618 start_codon:yes stop_codon:yes gene_type:complete
MKIVCIGSSSVEGIGDSKGYGWTGRLNEYLQENSSTNEYRVFNLGLKGDFLKGTINRYNSEAILRRPHLVIVFTGSNDCITHFNGSDIVKSPNKDDYTKQWDDFLLELKKADHKTLILGPTMVNEKAGPLHYNGLDMTFKNDDLAEYNNVLKGLCKTHDINFLEQFNLFADNIEDLSFDFVHPNDKGYDMLFNNLLQYLKENDYV